ncbi:hypothetical protein K504DRAFT_452431 [Pleomassaria siparia CBS 279.74]|uniref:Uncharacterized protein n=1 Tax=Pleomassaria siparia CBS 279.74 TaxID=1314801 RepID=A0A6G1KH99_9PLEO|nr:hypothetical protein K504DRAFT_452431 [Pleomassaria siparia CBS 279.74]
MVSGLVSDITLMVSLESPVVYKDLCRISVGTDVKGEIVTVRYFVDLGKDVIFSKYYLDRGVDGFDDGIVHEFFTPVHAYRRTRADLASYAKHNWFRYFTVIEEKKMKHRLFLDGRMRIAYPRKIDAQDVWISWPDDDTTNLHHHDRIGRPDIWQGHFTNDAYKEEDIDMDSLIKEIDTRHPDDWKREAYKLWQVGRKREIARFLNGQPEDGMEDQQHGRTHVEQPAKQDHDHDHDMDQDAMDNLRFPLNSGHASFRTSALQHGDNLTDYGGSLYGHLTISETETDMDEELSENHHHDEFDHVNIEEETQTEGVIPYPDEYGTFDACEEEQIEEEEVDSEAGTVCGASDGCTKQQYMEEAEALEVRVRLDDDKCMWHEMRSCFCGETRSSTSMAEEELDPSPMLSHRRSSTTSTLAIPLEANETAIATLIAATTGQHISRTQAIQFLQISHHDTHEALNKVFTEGLNALGDPGNTWVLSRWLSG